MNTRPARGGHEHDTKITRHEHTDTETTGWFIAVFSI